MTRQSSGASSTPKPMASDRGLATPEPRELAKQTAQAWNHFYEVAASVDLNGPTRRRGIRARRVVAKVGDWPESHQLDQILSDAAAGNLADIDQDAIDDRVIAAHESDAPDEILAAVARARDSVLAWESGHVTGELAFDNVAMREVGSPLGPLPTVTYAHAAAFQLAIAARDIRPHVPIPQGLALAGLRALVDTTGAIAARMSIDSALSVITDVGAVFTRSIDAAWTAGNLADEAGRKLPGIEGEAGVILDVAAGRQSPFNSFGKPKISIRGLSQLLVLTPITRDVPGLPGGVMLSKAAGLLSAVNLRGRRFGKASDPSS